MDTNAKIVVTGGTGFIGSYIIRSLLERGYHNITACKRKNSRLDLLGKSASQINWVDCELGDVVGLSDLVASHDAVIHAAALVSFNPKDRGMLMQTNVRGTANLVNACLEQNVKRMIHISSIGVFPRMLQGEIIDESVSWSGEVTQSDYAISKYQSELEVWSGGAEGLSIVILNPSLVIGGGWWASGTASIFQQIDQGLKFYPAGATGVVDVRDVAEAVIKCLQSSIHGERIIISAENNTFEHLLTQISTLLGKQSPTTRLNRFLIELALLRSWLLGKISPSNRVLTRVSLHNAQHNWAFDHSKSKRLLKLNYRSVDEVLAQTARSYQQSKTEKKDFGILPMS